MELLESVEVAFCHLITPKKFDENSEAKFEITVTMPDDKAKELEALGIKVKTYEGQRQRTFRSKYDVRFVDKEKVKQTEELPRGSVVDVAFELGEPYGNFGNSTFLKGVQVIEKAESKSSEMFEAKDEPAPADDDLPF